MPTTKKRINLTVPDELYEKLQAYKEKRGIESDASACLQLITQQLRGLEQSELLFDYIRRENMDKLLQLTTTGFQGIKKNEL